MKMIGIVVAAAGFMLAAGVVRADELAHVQKIADKLCSACHGQNGNSQASTYPNLAGQPAAYLAGQLRAFRDRTRSDKDAQDVMWGWTRSLTDQDIADLAAYYAAQPPLPGPAGSPTLTRKGADIYQNGAPEKGIPACAACHGADARGNENAPRLAGQHARYLVRQLKVFRSMDRPAAIAMHAIVTNLSNEDIAALAVFLQAR